MSQSSTIKPAENDPAAPGSLAESLDSAIAEELDAPHPYAPTVPIDLAAHAPADLRIPAHPADSFASDHVEPAYTDETRVMKQPALDDMGRARAAGVKLATARLDPLPTGVTLVLAAGSREWRSQRSLVLIGRVREVVDVPIVDDDQVSRHHAALTYTDGSYFIEDLQSTNGTKVDRVRVTRVKLQPPCVFVVGRTPISFSIAE